MKTILALILLISTQAFAQSLIGSGANQVPTNGLLGTMAFEDSKNYFSPVSVNAREGFQNNLTADTETQLYFTDVVHATHPDSFNGSAFTAPYDGSYFINIAYATSAKSLSGKTIYSGLKVGADYVLTSSDNISTIQVVPHMARLQGTLRLKKGDVVTVFSTCPDTILTNSDVRYSSFSIHRVSP